MGLIDLAPRRKVRVPFKPRGGRRPWQPEERTRGSLRCWPSGWFRCGRPPASPADSTGTGTGGSSATAGTSGAAGNNGTAGTTGAGGTTGAADHRRRWHWRHAGTRRHGPGAGRPRGTRRHRRRGRWQRTGQRGGTTGSARAAGRGRRRQRTGRQRAGGAWRDAAVRRARRDAAVRRARRDAAARRALPARPAPAAPPGGACPAGTTAEFGCGPSRTMGYMGCSMSVNVATGYGRRMGMRMWPAISAYGGQVVQSWTPASGGAWSAFDSASEPVRHADRHLDA